jgi:hypothetical protein
MVALVLTQSHRATAAEKIKNWNWQTGKLLDSERNSYLAGTVGRNTTVPGAGYQTFQIEGDQYVYMAQEWFRETPANLTVNGPVKFAVEKQTLFVLDEDGKQHEMEIVKKTIRQEPAK